MLTFLFLLLAFAALGGGGACLAVRSRIMQAVLDGLWRHGLFPRGDRAPAIEPVGERALRRLLATDDGLALWRPARTQRVASGFYTSQAFELARERS